MTCHIKIYRLAFLMFASVAVGSVLPCRATDPITLGAAEKVTTDFYVDCSATSLKKSSAEFYHLMSNSEGVSKFYGPLNKPFQNYIWTRDYHEYVDWNGYTPWDCRFYLASVYKINATEFLSFSHVERTDETGSFYDFRTVLLYSSTGCDNWICCGDILQHRHPEIQTNMDANMCGVPYLIRDDYFYIYFNESDGKKDLGISVARAPLAEVISAARKHTVCKWKNYYQGKWEEDGLGGRATPLNPGGYSGDSSGFISFNTALGKYIMTVTFNGDKLVLLTSSDGIKWDNQMLVADYTGQTDPEGLGYYPAYSWHCGFGGADDCHVLGSQFYVYYTRHDSSFADHGVTFRHLVTIGTSSPAPQ